MTLKIENRVTEGGVAVIELSGRMMLSRESRNIEPKVLTALQEYIDRENIPELNKLNKTTRLQKLDEKLLPKIRLNEIRFYGKEPKHVRRFGADQKGGYAGWSLKLQKA